MRLSSVRVRNIGSFYGEHELDLSGVDAYAVAGPNRSGKSLLSVDAPLAALYGHTRSGRSLRQWVSDGEKEMELGLLLNNGVTIERRVKSGKGSVRVSGWEGAQVGDAQDAIVRLLGLTRDDWLSTYVFSQDDAQRLVTARAGERKELIQRWVCRDLWPRLHGHAQQRLTETRRRVDRLEGRVEALSAEYDAPDKAELRRLRSAVTRTRKAAERAEAAVPDYRPSEPPEELGEAEALWRESQRALRTAEANALEFDGICPVIQVACPVEDKIRERGDALCAVVEDAQKAADSARERLSQLRTAEKARQDTGATEFKEARTAALRASQEARRAKAELERAEMRAEEADKRLQQQEQAERDLKAARRSLATWTYVARMLGRDGIPAAELEGAVGDAEDVANDIVLRALGVDYRVEFSFGRELRSWREDCARCGSTNRSRRQCGECGEDWQKKRSDDLDVLVRSGERALPFSQESGGCRDGLSMALRLAFARRLGEWGTAICDEVFRSMDRPTQQAAASFLFGQHFFGLGYEQLCVVTHDAEMLSAAPRLLSVWQEDGRSGFEWTR